MLPGKAQKPGILSHFYLNRRFDVSYIILRIEDVNVNVRVLSFHQRRKHKRKCKHNNKRKQSSENEIPRKLGAEATKPFASSKNCLGYVQCQWGKYPCARGLFEWYFVYTCCSALTRKYKLKHKKKGNKMTRVLMVCSWTGVSSILRGFFFGFFGCPPSMPKNQHF